MITDLYFTVNTCHHARGYKTKLSGYKWAYPERKEKHLSHLNACYVDLDVGRTKQDAKTKDQTRSVGFTIGALIELQGRELIPPISLYARSGRGLYALWFLQESVSDFTPPKAWPEKTVLYKQINKALQSRLSGLAPDPVAFDAARVLRVPESIHSKTGQTVKYWAQYDENFGMPYYTLKELAGLVGVPLAHNETILELKKVYGRITKDPGTAPKKAAGRAALLQKRLDDYFAIEQLHMVNRGHTWTHGKRRRALSYLALFLLSNGYSKADAMETVKQSAANCSPPYPSDPSDMLIADIVGSVDRKTLIRNKELLRVFDVSPEFYPDLKTILPDDERARRITENKSSIITAKDEKFNAIFKMMKRSPEKLSTRAMKKRLNRQGLDISHERARQIRDEILADSNLVEELEKVWGVKMKAGRAMRFPLWLEKVKNEG